MSTIEQSIEVAVPVRTAYNQWTQFEEFPRFMEGVEEVRQIDDTRLHWRTKVGGREQEFDAEITEQRPDERIARASSRRSETPSACSSAASRATSSASRSSSSRAGRRAAPGAAKWTRAPRADVPPCPGARASHPR
jgi:hypothetical protein